MNDTKLILIRHAATANNLEKPPRLQGQRADHPLSEQGIAQATALAKTLKNIPISAIYSSPLQRAMQTAGYVANGHNLEVMPEEQFLEADIGDWEDIAWDEIERSWPTEYKNFMDDCSAHGYCGGENTKQVCDRVLPAIEEIVANHQGETIAIVAHNVVNRALLAYWMDIHLKYTRHIPQENSGYNLIRFRHKDDQPAKAKVLTINRIEHLE